MPWFDPDFLSNLVALANFNAAFFTESRTRCSW
jgi:hypothetical protein